MLEVLIIVIRGKILATCESGSRGVVDWLIGAGRLLLGQRHGIMVRMAGGLATACPLLV